MIDEKEKRCVHFNGIRIGFCKAGVDYSSIEQRPVKQPSGKNKMMLACFGDLCDCEKYVTNKKQNTLGGLA